MTSKRPQYPREAIQARFGSPAQEGEDDSNTAQLDAALSAMIDIVFFASLESEEGNPTRVRVVYHLQGIDGLRSMKETHEIGGGTAKTPSWQILPFEHADDVTELTVKNLAKIAPAAILPRTAVVVAERSGQFTIQGLARRMEHGDYPAEEEEHSFMLSATRPGHLVLSHQGRDIFLYQSGAGVEVDHRPSLYDMLNHDESVIHTAMRSICVKTVKKHSPRSVFEFDPYRLISQAIIGLVQTMTTGAHGGLIAVLPDANHLHQEAVKGKYRFHPSHSMILHEKIAEVARTKTENWRRLLEDTTPEAPAAEKNDFSRADRFYEDWENTALEALIENVGKLSTIDNALLLGPELEVLCAGYPIASVDPLPTVRLSESLKGDSNEEFPLLRHGSRHRAAANFAHQFPGGLVFLCSQDGDLRCLHRPCDLDHVLLWNLSRPDW